MAVSWLTISCQVVVSWLCIYVSCGRAHDPTIFVFGLLSYGARSSPRQEPKLAERGLLQLMAHRPNAIDGAGADGSAEGAGGVEPDPSNDHGGCGTCIDQVVVPTAPPPLIAGDKDAVCHRVVNERRLPKPRKSQHLVGNILWCTRRRR